MNDCYRRRIRRDMVSGSVCIALFGKGDDYSTHDDAAVFVRARHTENKDEHQPHLQSRKDAT